MVFGFGSGWQADFGEVDGRHVIPAVKIPTLQIPQKDGRRIFEEVLLKFLIQRGALGGTEGAVAGRVNGLAGFFE